MERSPYALGYFANSPDQSRHDTHHRAQEQRIRPNPRRLDIHDKLRHHVVSKLILNWSSEQIAGELPMSYPDDETMRISHETIYKTIYVQARGVLKKELCSHLRSKRKLRKSKNAGNKSPKQGQIIDSISIRERPAEAEDRVIPGHWEGDLVLCTIDSVFVLSGVTMCGSTPLNSSALVFA